MSNITRNTYICAVHWPGEKRPTDKHPDPLKATLTPSELLELTAKASCTKRKAPKERSFYISKKMKVEQTRETSSLPDSDTEVAQLDQLDDDGGEQEYLT